MSKEAKWFLGIIGIILSLAVLFVALGFFSLVGFLTRVEPAEEEITDAGRDKVVVLELKGIILSSESLIKQIKRYVKRRGVKAIVLYIDSPGGGVAASEEIYRELKRARESKPVVISMGSVAASGGYYVALGGTKIVANPGTITGSIGVIAQFVNIKRLMDKIGIDFEIIKSGKFKDSGTPYRGMTEEERKYFQEVIDNVYEEFVNLVAEERGIPIRRVRKFADGRIFTGKQAYEIGLVDTIGTLEDAISIAAKLAGIEGEPRIIKPKRKKRTLLDLFLNSLTKSELDDIRRYFINQPILQYRLEHSF
jgi:protease-4